MGLEDGTAEQVKLVPSFIFQELVLLMGFKMSPVVQTNKCLMRGMLSSAGRVVEKSKTSETNGSS